MPELTSQQLTELLAKLDEMLRQAQELSTEIKKRMGDERQRDQVASDWSDRRRRAERRKRQRG